MSTHSFQRSFGQVVSPLGIDWTSLPSLRLLVRSLPSWTNTKHLYRNWSKHGHITEITLPPSKEGDRTVSAEVIFEPPPQTAFWEKKSVYIWIKIDKDDKGEWHRVSVEPCHNQKPAWTTQSPVRPGVIYRDKMSLTGRKLEFGILAGPRHMQVMATCGDQQHKPTIQVAIRRKEIKLNFPYYQITPKSLRGPETARFRDFRLVIGFEQTPKVWNMPDGSFIIVLNRIPRFSKMLIDGILQSHKSDARKWSEEDGWTRQTGIFKYTSIHDELLAQPLSLHKDYEGLNISDWNVIHFHMSDDDNDQKTRQDIFDALSDWNLDILDGKDFSFTHIDNPQELESQKWRLINATYKESTGSSVLVTSHTIGQIQGQRKICLSFPVRYQLEVCLSHGYIQATAVTHEFLLELSMWTEDEARQALVFVASREDRLLNPMTLFHDLRNKKPVRSPKIPSTCNVVYTATVTASTVLFNTPGIEITNRIIRANKQHSHRFLRVRFEDDEYLGDTKMFPTTNARNTLLFTRVERILCNGIKMGDMHWQFLAWGNSQLREHGAYFFAPTPELGVDDIVNSMGRFNEKIIAKKAARMGQCLASTKAVNLQLPIIHELETIPDIQRGKFIFSDGVGRISRKAAEKVCEQLRIPGDTPSMFQFRLGGCKGVLAITDEVDYIAIKVRKSQFKFQSDASDLEIIRPARFWSMFTNRQIILVLSALGVPDEVFLNKQQALIKTVNDALDDDQVAIQALRRTVDQNRMTLSICELVEAGMRQVNDPFTMALLHLWRSWTLQYLKEKTKIPIEKAAFLLGGMDETATLRGHSSDCPTGDIKIIMQDPAYLDKLPQIFCQITNPVSGRREIITGLCFIGRNPSLHKGDIRVVHAIDVPALHHMCDVVVMPQLGDRDLPSMCSGGDLDGDDYFVVWDEELLPRVWNTAPFHYDPPSPRQAVGEIARSDLIEFFCEYLRNDSLGRIANAHLAWSDFRSIEDPMCLELAELHSLAVDYPKTGVPAKFEMKHEVVSYPHFMEKRKTYRSHKVLGKLYDQVKTGHHSQGHMGKVGFKPDYKLPFDRRILRSLRPDPAKYQRLQELKVEYDSALERVMKQYSIRTEFEFWTTLTLGHHRSFNTYKFGETLGDLTYALKHRFYLSISEEAGGEDFEHLAPWAVTAYQLTSDQVAQALLDVENGNRSEAAEDMPFISFPWILQDTLLKIAKLAHKGNTILHSEASVVPIAGLQLALDTTQLLHPVDDERVGVEPGDFSECLSDPYNPAALAGLQADFVKPPDKITKTICGTSFQDECNESAILANRPSKTTSALARSLLEEQMAVSINPDTPTIRKSALGSDQKSDSFTTTTIREAPDGSQDHRACWYECRYNFCPDIISKPGGLCPPEHRVTYQHTLPELACNKWSTYGECRYSKAECEYAHRKTGITAPSSRRIQQYFEDNPHKRTHSKSNSGNMGVWSSKGKTDNSKRSSQRSMWSQTVKSALEGESDDYHGATLGRSPFSVARLSLNTQANTQNRHEARSSRLLRERLAKETQDQSTLHDLAGSHLDETSTKESHKTSSKSMSVVSSNFFSLQASIDKSLGALTNRSTLGDEDLLAFSDGETSDHAVHKIDLMEGSGHSASSHSDDLFNTTNTQHTAVVMADPLSSAFAKSDLEIDELSE